MSGSAVPACSLCGIVLAAASMTGALFAEGRAAEERAAEERAAARTPSDWLHAMDSAFRNLDYDGEFSYYTASHSRVEVQQQQGDRTVSFTAGIARDVKVATFRIVHMVIDGVERERIAHLGGPRREILRTGRKVSYILPRDDESFAVEDGLATGPYTRLFMRSQDLAANYRFDLSGRGEVIGRPTVCLEVNPLDDNRYGYLLWLDEETGLLLRSELRDADGTHLEMVQFTSLRVGDSVTANALEPAMSGVLVRPATEIDAEPEPPIMPNDWAVGWVPAGFWITDAHTHNHAKDGVHAIFSDGLATFSFFVDPAPESPAGGVFSRTGATVLLSRDLSSEQGDFLVTVVGEVPPKTAQRIAASVYREH